MKLVPGQLNYLALPPGQTAPFDVGALQRAGLPIAPYIEHGSWETGQPDIMFYGRDPYRGVMGMYGNYVTLNGLGNTAAAGVAVSIASVQNRLNQGGAGLTADGLWGSRTRTALEAFARAQGVTLPAFNTAQYKLVNNRNVIVPAALAAAIGGASGGKTQAWEPSGPADADASTDPTNAQKPFPGFPGTSFPQIGERNIMQDAAAWAPTFFPRNQPRPPTQSRRAAAPAAEAPPAPPAPVQDASPNRTLLYVGIVGTLALLGLGVFLLRPKKAA